MKFYLTPSKSLLCLFAFLYLAMICAVQLSSLPWVGKLLIISILAFHYMLVIKKHALLRMSQSVRRICCKDDLWHIENKAGNCVYGKLNSFVYISQLLIILSVTCLRNKKTVFALIPFDSLPPLQFRRLSMKTRY